MLERKNGNDNPIWSWNDSGGVACLEDKWGDGLGLENMCSPIIKVAVMAVKEEDLGVNLASSTCPTEETHCLHTAISVYISQRSVVD